MRSKIFKIRARGDLACFTRPEFKAERVSYEIPTPSALRGMIESIIWKPAIFWHIHEIALLKPIKFISIRRNEVKDRASLRSQLYIEDSRTQRNTSALRDVDYIISASFQLTPQMGERDSVEKFEQMFEYRLNSGKNFQQPYFGCREFVAHIEPAPASYKPVEQGITRPLGRMFYDFLFANNGSLVQQLTFDAVIRSGTVAIPSWQEVLHEGRLA